MKWYKRVAYLLEDATPYNDGVELRYRRLGHSSCYTWLPASACPPLEKLREGTKIYLFFTLHWGGQVLKVELTGG